MIGIPMVAILMGVAGSGKTTVGRQVAARLGWAFFDADDYHGTREREKMRRGEALTEADREDWLARLGALVAKLRREGTDAVIACSALRQAHRRRLQVGAPDVRLVYLRGDAATLRGRLAARRGHFFDPELLGSQLATLEEPAQALVVDVAAPADQIAARVAQFLAAQAP